MNIDRTVRRVRSIAQDIDADDILDMIGLERRRNFFAVALPAIGIFGAGILMGAGLGLVFAPSSGRALRREAESKVNDLKQRIRTNGARTLAEGREQVRDAVSSFESNNVNAS